MIPAEYLNQIVTGDARELAKRIPDESVDLIFTDPPYHREFLPLYGWLAEVAMRVLKPSGFLMAYCGGYFKDDIMAMWREHLTYYFEFVSAHGSYGTSIIWPRLIAVKHKGILCYTKEYNGCKPRVQVLSLWRGTGADKQHHAWGQDESTARYYIDCFSQSNDIVFDPFLGGGTVPAVCKMLGRNYVAFEIDPATAEAARERVQNTQPPLFVLEPEQTEMQLA